MGLDYALDELYASGWTDLDSAGCGHHTDGRGYPKIDRVRDEFAAAGYTFSIRRVDLFKCFRAEWVGSDGQIKGAVVSHNDTDAAVYALARFRRQQAPAAVAAAV
ncbi:MAG: hypothetical protein AB7G11_00870 [Phycisphaerales bacterium]